MNDYERYQDALDKWADGVDQVAKAITAVGVPGRDAAGGSISSLTEAVMGVTAGLCRIADSVGDLAIADGLKDVAEAIRELATAVRDAA